MTAEINRIVSVLKDNPRGMTVTDVARAVKMNRGSAAKYLEIMANSGRVDMKTFGPSKVYYISHRVPIWAMLGLTSDSVVTLDDKFRIILANDRFLELISRERENTMGKNAITNNMPLISRPEFLEDMKEALQGKELAKEICIQKLHRDNYYNIKLIPTVLDGGAQGVTITFEDITVRREAENDLRKAKEDLERQVAERTAELLRANETLQQEIKVHARREKLSDALNDVSLTINSSMDADEIMRRVVVVSAVALQCDTAFIAVKNIDQWTILYTHGIPADIRGATWPGCLVPEFIRTTHGWSPAAISDVAPDSPMNRHIVAGQGIKSSLVVPLTINDEITGAIFLNYHTAPLHFTDADTGFGRKLGASVSLALDNARLFRELLQQPLTKH